MSGSGGMLNSSIRRRLDNVRGHHVGSADVMGQGVQPQPPDRLLPQQERSGPGGAELRRAASADQAAPAAVGVWGAQPRRRAKARLPPVDSRYARVHREAGQVQASSLEPKAKTTGARSGPGDAASAGGSRAFARRPPSPPQAGAGGQRP